MRSVMARMAAFLLAAIGLGVSPLAQAECPDPAWACEYFSEIVGLPAVSTAKYCGGASVF